MILLVIHPEVVQLDHSVGLKKSINLDSGPISNWQRNLLPDLELFYTPLSPQTRQLSVVWTIVHLSVSPDQTAIHHVNFASVTLRRKLLTSPGTILPTQVMIVLISSYACIFILSLPRIQGENKSVWQAVLNGLSAVLTSGSCFLCLVDVEASGSGVICLPVSGWRDKLDNPCLSVWLTLRSQVLLLL